MALCMLDGTVHASLLVSAHTNNTDSPCCLQHSDVWIRSDLLFGALSACFAAT